MAQFICLHEGFCHYFDAVIDKLCLGMTFHPAKYFTVTRKQKVNRLILRGVTWDEMYMFISLSVRKGLNVLPHPQDLVAVADAARNTT